MYSTIPSAAFAIDISRSMDERYGYIGKKIEIARQIFFNLSEVLLRIRRPYRLHLYVFPSLIPDVIPCEKLYQLTILDAYALTLLKRVVDSITGTRPTTPLIESLTYIANDIESRGLIVVITDGVFIKVSNEKIGKLEEVLKEKDIYVTILNLNMMPPDLERISSDRIEIEMLYPSQLHPLLLNTVIEYIAYKISLKMR